MAGAAQPVTVVDRADLAAARWDAGRVSKVAASVRTDLLDVGRALRLKGFDVSDDDVPEEEALAGYVSNARAYLWNSSRRVQETVVDFSSGGGTKTQLEKWLGALSFNDNDFDLSMLSHARAVERAALRTWAERMGIDNFAMLIPPSEEFHVTGSGTLADYLGRVQTQDEWNADSQAENEGRKGMSLIFSLGLHHGDVHQMLPIPDELLPAAEEVLAEYRAELLARIAAGLALEEDG